MDASHVMVGGLTAVTIVLLVWAEIRSRRNTAREEHKATSAVLEDDRRIAGEKKREDDACAARTNSQS